VAWAPDYTTRQRLKDYLGIEHTDADVFLDVWITAVSRNVDDHCGRQFGIVAAPELRTYSPRWSRTDLAWGVEIDDVFDVSGMTIVDSIGTAVAGYELRPLNAPQKGKPYTELRRGSWSASGALTILAPWGWPAVPESIEAAMWLQAARLSARRDSPFGISGSPSEQGEIRLLAQLDPDFRMVLKPYVRKWWAR
jgi:hypothetical protein